MTSSKKNGRSTITRTAAEQASAVRERLSPVMERAAHTAREQAAVAAEQARDWAAPRIEAAAERAVPAVDAVRDRIVEDMLPRLVDAVNAAALAAAAAGVAAGEALGDATDSGARKAKAGLREAADRMDRASGRKRRRTARWIRVTAFVVVGAGTVAGVAAWLRARAEDRLPGPAAVSTPTPEGLDVAVEDPQLTTATALEPQRDETPADHHGS